MSKGPPNRKPNSPRLHKLVLVLLSLTGHAAHGLACYPATTSKHQPGHYHHHFRSLKHDRTWRQSSIHRQQQEQQKEQSICCSPLLQSIPNWEGDDLRWTTRFGRRLRQFIGLQSARHPGRNAILILNIAAFMYQTLSAVIDIRLRHPDYWPRQALTMILDALWGSSAVPGRMTMDFVHSTALSSRQPHRYLTAGFLHGGLLHLLLNMDALRRMPSWLETGLGTPLFLTTFCASIVTGNVGHTLFASYDSHALCLGASGGLTGLYGLMYVCLIRMGNSKAAMQILRGMATIILYGLVFANISNSAHVGGFVGGLFMGFFCGPRYTKSYSMRRKWSLEVDDSPRDYRNAMGFGTKPSSSGLVPLSAFWTITLIGILSQPALRSAPRLVLQGLLRPGSVTRVIPM